MTKFVYWQEGLIFIVVFAFVMSVPCSLIAFFGSRLIENLGQYPSKSAKFHIGTALPVLGSMVLSFGIFALFFHVFSD